MQIFSEIVKLTKNLSIILILILVVSCSSKKKSGPVEIISQSLSNTETPEEKLFNAAQDAYEREIYTLAQDNYQLLLDTYPDSTFKTYAELKLADTYFNLRNFQVASQKYENFKSDHPTSPDVAYATLHAARSYQLTSKGAGRDCSPLKKAIENYNFVIEKFPNSPFADSARVYRDNAQKILADSELDVINFYVKEKKEAAQNARIADYKKLYSDVNKTGELKHQTFGTLAYNNSNWKPKKINLHKTNKQKSSLSKKSTFKDKTEVLAKAEIEHLACSNKNPKLLFINLMGSEAEKVMNSYENDTILNPNEKGEVTLNLNDSIKYTPVKQNCFASKDLELSKNHSLVLKSKDPVKLITMKNPTRLVLVVQ